MGYKDKQLDYFETVAEEITLTTGLEAKVENDIIEIDTIAGVIKFRPVFRILMEDVYRFLYCYGSTLQKYGIKKRTEYKNTLKP